MICNFTADKHSLKLLHVNIYSLLIRKNDRNICIGIYILQDPVIKPFIIQLYVLQCITVMNEFSQSLKCFYVMVSTVNSNYMYRNEIVT